ncbi:MAG: cyclic beta 1-2 glucan synthetase, partial [Azoarcus sp.]|nr:cyclic beta 1-2 glucan synthetase [Azoarcus sp.]
LCEVLRQFAALATNRGDTAFATLCTAQREDLQHSLEAHGWDGEWYLRAYFDDGSQLGSAASTECRIDSISQSWAVLSGAADPERARTAMNAVDRHLVRRADGLIQLLDPPFDSGDLDPGYIRGYVPGVRENGGQYTHAAVWTAMAFAEQGDERRAWELLTLINPVNHALTAEAAGIYKVEPYVVAADVYACAPHTGRGGWSWHTGAAGWMYRLTVESLLGLKREGDVLHITPRLPADWPGFTMRYRHGATSYNIVVSQSDVDDSNESGVVTMTLDGNGVHGQSIRLVDDNLEHGIQIQLCRRNPGA